MKLIYGNNICDYLLFSAIIFCFLTLHFTFLEG